MAPGVPVMARPSPSRPSAPLVSPIRVAAYDSPKAWKNTAGFICDGTADDGGLQGALDALPSYGGEIQLGPGTYTWTAATTVSRAIDNVTIRGQGKGTVLNGNASTALISAGSQKGWLLLDFATDAGGITISSATNSYASYWKGDTLVTTFAHSDPVYFGAAQDVGISRVAANILGLAAGDSLRIPTDGFLYLGTAQEMSWRHLQKVYTLAGGDPADLTVHYVALSHTGQKSSLTLWNMSLGTYISNPPLCPGTAVEYIISAFGDVLIGDIWAIETNPMAYFRRQITLSVAKQTVMYSNRNTNQDGSGGASIAMFSDETGVVDSGYINIIAHGQGTGPIANSIRFLTRSGVDTSAERFRVGSTALLAGVDLDMANNDIDRALSLRLQPDATDDNILDQFSIEVSNVTTWSTLKTLSPSGVAGSYTAGIVEAWVGGDTGGVGDGVLIARWRFHISNAAPTVAGIGTDISWQSAASAAPQFRLNVSGNNIQCQVQSGDAIGAFYGSCVLKVFLPQFAGTARTWTVS